MAHINLIPGEQGVRLSTLSPKYLHTNSTSHTWPFSAIAELVDNAYDPDVEASQLWIDIERYGFEQCLTFTDNGAGMDSLKLHKMLSFGFCEKEAKNDHLPVGHYGNGFKSGSMRLGKDAIVFTKQQDSRSVGYLSQTYLTAVKAQTILVPIVSWDSQENMVQRADGDKALQDILKHGLFKTKKELVHQFNEIKSPTGTKIIINQMRRTQEGKYEFDFRTDYADIRIPDDIEMESNKYRRQERQNHIPESDYSLRAYCSILYLRPRMQIILRGKKVRTTVIGKSLSKTEVDAYRPNGVSRPIKVTFGFSQNKNHYGIMMYHRNRLIKPYVRVGYQLRANNLGVGVIGVIQCDYLQPTHNKQDFDYTKSYRSSMSALGSKLNDYWNEKKGKAQINSNVVIPEPKEVESVPDQLWVQCDNPECLKWRKLPPVITTENLPEKWYCRDHPDKRWRSCDVPEELEDDREEVVQPYVKKQKKRLEKELEEKKKKEKEAKRLKEMELEVKSKELQKKDAQISRLMQQVQAKSKQQQSAIQQIQASVKPEAASPQKLQIKFVGPTVSRQQGTPTAGTRKYLVHQTSDKKVILTPVTTHVTPQHTLTVKTHTTQTPNATVTRQTPNTTVTRQAPNATVTRQIAQKPQMVVMQGNITPKRPILQKPTTPTSVSVNTCMPGQGPKMVNIVSKGTPTGSKTNPVVIINTGKVISQPALHPKVGGPPVIIKVSSQAAAEKVKYFPTMVPVAAVIDPKVVSVHSLAMPPIQPRLSVATPGTSNVLIRPAITSTHINVQSPTLAVPSNLSARASNTQVTPALGQTVALGPQTATLGQTAALGPQTATLGPQTATLGQTAALGLQTAALGPQTVTLGQTAALGPQTATIGQTVTPALQVKTPTVVKTEPQNSTSPNAGGPNVSNLKRPHDQNKNSDEPVARKQKSDADVIIIDPPSPPPIRPISPQAVGIKQEPNGNKRVPNMDTSMPNMDTSMPNMDTSIPNMDLVPDVDTSMVEANGEKSEVDKNVPDVDTVIQDCNMDNIDKDVIDDVKSMSPRQQLQSLLNRTQKLKQLYSLRENVLKLLRVLVPELEVDDLNEKFHDQTVDELLQQVLEQAERSELDNES